MILSMYVKNGRWLVNEKRVEDLDLKERLALDSFFREIKKSKYEPVS